jgi:putative acetyltransferase
MNLKLDIEIRPETRDDYAAITKLNDLAFEQKTEGKLVEKLRETKEFIPALSLVAQIEGEIVGHILFYPIKIDTVESSVNTLALAPISVRPEYQRMGIGGKLVRAGIESARDLGHKSVIVIGHPEYYPRFGFKPASGWGIITPFAVPDDAFLALELEVDALKNAKGTVKYPEAFNEE